MGAKVHSLKGNNLEKLERSPSIVSVFMEFKKRGHFCPLFKTIVLNKRDPKKIGLETASLE